MQYNLVINFYQNADLIIHDNTKMTLKDEIISFQSQDMKHILNLKTNVFQRENEEYQFNLDFKNKNSQIILKKEQYILQLQVEYAIILQKQKEIEMTYKLETDEKKNRLVLKWEEI